MTLLEQAKAVPALNVGKRPLDEDKVALALAFSRREITSSQAGKVLKKTAGAAQTQLAGWLMTAIRRGVLKVEKV